MTIQTSPVSNDIWERWHPIWQVVFVVLWIVAMLLTLTDSLGDDEARGVAGIFALCLLIWYFLTTFMMKRLSAVGRTIYFLVGWCVWFMSAYASPSFFILLFGLFPHVFMVMSLAQAILLSLVLNSLILILLGQIDANLSATWVIMLAGTTLVGGVLAYFIHTIITQSTERQRLIAELEATQDQLAKSQYEAGILSERQRLAGELHDTIAQGLVAIVVHLESGSPPSDHAIGQAIAIARENLRSARRFIWNSEALTADYHHFIAQLREAVAIWSSQTTIPCELIITGDTFSFSSQVAHALLRVCQEALQNVHKHAQATYVTITLSFIEDTLILDVNDNGKGFDSLAVSGFGLKTMRRRIADLGGEFSVESTIGVGTTLTTILTKIKQNGQKNGDTLVDSR